MQYLFTIATSIAGEGDRCRWDYLRAKTRYRRIAMKKVHRLHGLTPIIKKYKKICVICGEPGYEPALRGGT